MFSAWLYASLICFSSGSAWDWKNGVDGFIWHSGLLGSWDLLVRWPAVASVWIWDEAASCTRTQRWLLLVGTCGISVFLHAKCDICFSFGSCLRLHALAIWHEWLQYFHSSPGTIWTCWSDDLQSPERGDGMKMRAVPDSLLPTRWSVFMLVAPRWSVFMQVPCFPRTLLLIGL